MECGEGESCGNAGIEVYEVRGVLGRVLGKRLITIAGEKYELCVVLPDVNSMSDQELAVWYNYNVIYPDKVRLNKWYFEHYSFWKDIEMIFATVLGRKVRFGGEEI